MEQRTLTDISEEFASLDQEDALTKISRSEALLESLYEKIEEKEDELKALQKQRDRMEAGELPALMEELGLETMKMSSGKTITLQRIYSGKLTADATKFLIETNADGIVKNEIKITCENGLEHNYDAFISELRDRGFEPKLKSAVHPATMGAYIKEQYNTPEFPKDAFQAKEFKKIKYK